MPRKPRKREEKKRAHVAYQKLRTEIAPHVAALTSPLEAERIGKKINEGSANPLFTSVLPAATQLASNYGRLRYRLARLKNANETTIDRVLDATNADARAVHRVYGTPFPRSYSGWTDQPNMPFTDSLATELRW